MVLVDGSDVKKKYLEIIDDIRLFLEKSIRDSIIVNSQRISKEISVL